MHARRKLRLFKASAVVSDLSPVCGEQLPDRIQKYSVDSLPGPIGASCGRKQRPSGCSAGKPKAYRPGTADQNGGPSISEKACAVGGSEAAAEQEPVTLAVECIRGNTGRSAGFVKRRK